MTQRITPSYRVAILDLGERLRIKLPLLARKLNSLQHTFYFDVVDSITIDAIGDPDVLYQYYSVQLLFSRLMSRRDYSKFDFLVGVTDLQITDSEDTESKEKLIFLPERS